MFRVRHLLLTSIVVSLLAAPAVAQEAETGRDMTDFGDACIGARAFFLPDLAAEIDPAPMLTPLCACLSDSLAEFPEEDIAMLKADLDGTATDEMHAAHPDYAALQQRAAPALNFCFASPEVQAGAAILSIGAEDE